MFSWSIFILSLATLALSAVQTSSSFTPTLFLGAAVPTPFVGSTMSQCMHSCVNDAADANHCDGPVCVCIDPKFQQAVAACLQSRCSFTEQEVALQVRHGTKCYRAILAVNVQTSALSQQAGVSPSSVNWNSSSTAMYLEVGSGFVVAALVNVIGLIL